MDFMSLCNPSLTLLMPHKTSQGNKFQKVTTCCLKKHFLNGSLTLSSSSDPQLQHVVDTTSAFTLSVAAIAF